MAPSIGIPPSARHLTTVAARGTIVRGGVEGVTSLTIFMRDVRDAINAYRALLTADLVYLRRFGFSEIARMVGESSGELALSHTTVREWLERDGPKSYLSVAATGDGFVLARIPVLGLNQTRREINAAILGGRRIAPAVWEVGDGVDPAILWRQLQPVHAPTDEGN